MKARSLFALISILLGGCDPSGPAAEAPQLNSERIEARYGSYGVEILSQSGDRRVSCLYSVSDGQRICRTIAIVLFDADVPAALAPPLERVRAGGSLGATLAENGWAVDKRHLHVGTHRVPSDSDSAVAGLFDLEPPTTLALHLYELHARQAQIDVRVATLLEIHHPDYLDTSGLQRIYAVDESATLPPGLLDDWHRRIAELSPRED